MKTSFPSSFRTLETLPQQFALTVATLLIGMMSLTAQTFTTLKSFGILTNVSGFNPNAPLVQGPDGTLYGTTSAGESTVRGTVFRVQPDGSGFAVLGRVFKITFRE